MKIELDLKHSFNNYNWENKEELKDFIDNYMIPTLWQIYESDEENNFLDDEERNRLYDILDMFRKYEIK